MSTKIDNRSHFGISIFEHHIIGFDQHQQALVEQCTSIKKAEQGITRSNQGGWHSGDELHSNKHPSIQWLMQQLYTVGQQCIKHHENNDPSIRDIHLVNSWANINEFGDWNAPHHHAPQDWSGVVYIDTDTIETKQQAIQDGDIVFFDPQGPTWLKNRSCTINYPAEIGKMFLFPAHLLHMVAPYTGKRPRISIAFNFKIIYT